MANSWPFFNLIKLIFVRVRPTLKPHILFYSNRLVIQLGLPNIEHLKVNNGRYSAILNLTNLYFSGSILPSNLTS